MTRPVPIDARAAAAYGLDVEELPDGAVVVLAGAVVRVRADGGLEEVLPGGHPHGGAAFDPSNRRRAA